MHTKDTIINSAIELFNKNGIKSVTMRQIADHAGIAIGNLTYYFPQKQLLIKEIMDSAYLNINDTEEINDIAGLAELLRKDIIAITKMRFYFLNLDYIKSILELKERDDNVSTKMERDFRQQFQHLQDIGLFKVDDQESIDAILEIIWISHLGYITFTNNDDVANSLDGFIAKQLRSLYPFATEEGKKQILICIDDHDKQD